MFKESKFEIETKKEKEPQEKSTRFDYYRLMSGLIARAEELMAQKKDLAGEKIVKLLVEDPRNEAQLTPKQIEIIEKMVQRYEDAKHDLLSYVYDLADKFKIRKLPKNPVEILEKDEEVKLQFLYDVGFKPYLDPSQFKIHFTHPTAIGIECKNFSDYVDISGWSKEVAVWTRGFFTHKDFAGGVRLKEDKERVKKLNEKIYFLNGEVLARYPKEQKKRVEIHEIQHHLFRRYFDTSRIAELCHEREEIRWQIIPQPSKEEVKEKQLSLIAKEAKISQEYAMIPKAEILENLGRNEFAAYLKEGLYRYNKRFLFGEEGYKFVEYPKSDKMWKLRINFDEVKKELWRLEAGETDPKKIYRIFEIMPNFKEIKEGLLQIDSKISKKGLINLLNDEDDVNLLVWLKDYVVEEKHFDIKPLTLEIEKWCAKKLMKILEKNIDTITKSDLDLADKYVLRTGALVGRVNAEIKDTRNKIAAQVLENIYRRVAGMDKILASAIKEARYNPYNGEEIKTIDERIAFAGDLMDELLPVWNEFASLIEKIYYYEPEEAAILCEEMYDPKDGHRLSIWEKRDKAKEELEDLKKMLSEFLRIVSEIEKIDAKQANDLMSEFEKERSLRAMFKKARAAIEKLKG
jgi:hypothetical protein